MKIIAVDKRGIHYKKNGKNGAYLVPHDIGIPANAESIFYDPEESVVSYKVGEEEHTVNLDIDDLIQAVDDYVASSDPIENWQDTVAIEQARRIEMFAPRSEQNTLIARALELVSIPADGGTLTTEQADELNVIRAIWNKIKQIKEAAEVIQSDAPTSDVCAKFDELLN